MRRLLTAGFVIAAGCYGYAQAQSAPIALTPDDIIAARQSAFAMNGALFGDMKRAVDAKVTEVKPYKDGAEAMAKWGGSIPTLFPAGTEQGHNTKAKPAVWSDRAGFEKAAQAFVAAAGTLAKAAEANDAAAFATAFADTGKTCGGCHRPYRER